MLDPGVHKKRITGFELVSIVAVHKSAGAGLDYVNLALVVRRLKVLATRCVHEQSHTAVGEDRVGTRVPSAAGAYALFRFFERPLTLS